MFYVVAGILLLLALAGAGRRKRQREMVASLKRNFVVEARQQLQLNLAALANAVPDAELERCFNWIYAEHLRRLRARDFADLLRKGQSKAAQSVGSDICFEAGPMLCSEFRSVPGVADMGAVAGFALSTALDGAGSRMYAEMI